MAYARQVELVDLSNTRSLRPTAPTARVLDTSPRTSASSLTAAAAAGTVTVPPLSRITPTVNTSNNNNNIKTNYNYYNNSNYNNNTASSNHRNSRHAASAHHESPPQGSPRRRPLHAPPPPPPAEPSQPSLPQQRHDDDLSPCTRLSVEQREDMFRQCLSTSCVDVDELRRIVWAHGMPGTSDTLTSSSSSSSPSSTPSSPTSATDGLFSTRSKASTSSWVRPLTWKLLCGYLPPERSEWASVLASNRARYWAAVHDATIDPSARPMDGDHPLSESDTSQWREFFRDADVRALIARDAQRTHADLPAVHQRIRDPLERLLFVYAKNHPNPGYRQGMNELAAPFLIVFAQDIKGNRSTASSTLNRQQQQQGGFGFGGAGGGGGGGMRTEGIDFDYVTTLSDVGMSGVDESDVEADAYFCFCKIMKEMITCYVKDTPSPSAAAAASASSLTSSPMSSVSAGNHHSMAISPMLPIPKSNAVSLSSRQPTTSTSTSASSTVSAPAPAPAQSPNAQQQQGIGRQLRELQALLRIKDPKLEGRLDSLGIDPRFYGLRWIRLWLSHEFKLPDCLCLWDSFLTAEVRLPWIRYVCVAMLIRVRNDLLNADFTKCMKMLLNYPSCDVAQLLRIADRLRTSNAVIVRTARS